MARDAARLETSAAELRATYGVAVEVLPADLADRDQVLRVADRLADPARPVGEALLDQRNLAGIGNLYANELCFLAGVHPRRPVGEVPDHAWSLGFPTERRAAVGAG